MKKEINGYEYSMNRFEGYKTRSKIKISTVGQSCEFDIYTTATDKHDFENALLDRRHEDVTSIIIMHWSTKEQDEAVDKLIEEWFKG